MLAGFAWEGLAPAVDPLDPEDELGDLLGVDVVPPPPPPLCGGTVTGVVGVLGGLASEPVWTSGTLTLTSGTVALTCGTVALTSGTTTPTPGTVTLGTVRPTLGVVKPTLGTVTPMLGTDRPKIELSGVAEGLEARAWPPPAARMPTPNPTTDTATATALAAALPRRPPRVAEERPRVAAGLPTRLGEVDRGTSRLGLHPDIVHEGGHQRKPPTMLAARRALRRWPEGPMVMDGDGQAIVVDEDSQADVPSAIGSAVPDRIRHRLVDGEGELLAVLGAHAKDRRRPFAVAPRGAQARWSCGQAQQGFNGRRRLGGASVHLKLLSE
jgi:hypothetical protein